jgi:regulator of replication initiation timing
MKLLFTFILLSSICFGQSKKDQIESLNGTIDSLTSVLSNTRVKSVEDISSLNSKIKEISDEITAIKGELTNLQASSTKLTTENDKLKIDLGELFMKNLELEAKLKVVEEERDGNNQKTLSEFWETFKNSVIQKDWKLFETLVFYPALGQSHTLDCCITDYMIDVEPFDNINQMKELPKLSQQYLMMDNDGSPIKITYTSGSLYEAEFDSGNYFYFAKINGLFYCVGFTNGD